MICSTGSEVAASNALIRSSAELGARNSRRKRPPGLRPQRSSRRYDGLAGVRFPAPRHSYPTKEAMADYLEEYASRFELPVRAGRRAHP